MADLANCTRCGKVFAKQIRDICRECFKKEENDFNIVYHFLQAQKNREATLQNIVKQTGVAEDIIIKFIKSKRLRTSNFPSLAYPCKQCRTEIVAGNLCENCSKKMIQELELHEEKKQEKTNKQPTNVYFSLDKRNKQ